MIETFNGVAYCVLKDFLDRELPHDMHAHFNGYHNLYSTILIYPRGAFLKRYSSWVMQLVYSEESGSFSSVNSDFKWKPHAELLARKLSEQLAILKRHWEE